MLIEILTEFSATLSRNPLAQMEEEKREHESKMKKMEAEMEQVFEMKVKEKKQKLKDSELELTRRHEERKKVYWNISSFLHIVTSILFNFRLLNFKSASWKNGARHSNKKRLTGSSRTVSPWMRCEEEAWKPTAKSELFVLSFLTPLIALFPPPLNWLFF